MAGAAYAAPRYAPKPGCGFEAVSYATVHYSSCLRHGRLGRVLVAYGWLQDSATPSSSAGMGALRPYTAGWRRHIPPDGGEQLSGVVAVDEAWFGRKRHSKRGQQTIVMGGIEVDTRRLRLQVIPDTEQDSIELFLEAWVARGSHLITDAHASYQGVAWLGYSREAYNHSAGHFGMSNHIECIWSAMKRHLRKLYGCIPTHHLTPFLREWEARHNQRSLFESPLAYLTATVVTD